MLLTARRSVEIKGVTIGGGNNLICVPIVARDERELSGQAGGIAAERPDMVEWRADFFEGVENPARLKRALDILEQAAGSIPIVFTCRARAEGGVREIGLKDRLDIIDTALSTGVPDIIDFELSSGSGAVRRVVGSVRESKRQTVLSFHDFHKTPPGDFIMDKLYSAQQAGGDMAKVAVMPQSADDVLTLLKSSLDARRGPVEIPIAAVAMGKIGVVTRMAGWLFGSDITFASGGQSSAPGQIPIGRLRLGIGILRESLLAGDGG